MSEREDDLRLERELRDVLGDEIPGRRRTACEGAWTACRRRPHEPRPGSGRRRRDRDGSWSRLRP